MTTQTQKKRQGEWHIKNLPAEARAKAMAGAILEDKPVGEWLAEAIQEKWERWRLKDESHKNRMG